MKAKFGYGSVSIGGIEKYIQNSGVKVSTQNLEVDESAALNGSYDHHRMT
jgi:hypothetical protein